MDVESFDEQANLDLALSFEEGEVFELARRFVESREELSSRLGSIITDQFDRELRLLDFAGSIVSALELIFGLRDQHGLPTVWIDRTSSSALYFQLLLHSIAESVYSIGTLAKIGAGAQSRTVCRYLVETCDVTIACVGNESVLDAFSQVPKEKDASIRHWRMHLSPSVIRRVVSQIEEPYFEMESPLHSTIRDMRHTTYGWLSKFTHVDLIGYLTQSADDCHVDMAGATLKHTILYLFFFLLSFRKLLVEKHAWFADRSAQRPDARQCDFQEKLCFVLIQRYQEYYLNYRRDDEGEETFDIAAP